MARKRRTLNLINNVSNVELLTFLKEKEKNENMISQPEIQKFLTGPQIKLLELK